MIPESNSQTVLVNKSKIARRKNQLKRLHKLYSWRKMAKEIFNGEIKFGTLERFATDPDYVPKEIELLRVLDLLTERKLRRFLPKWYIDTQEAKDYWLNQREHQREMQSDTNTIRHGKPLDKEWQHVERQ